MSIMREARELVRMTRGLSPITGQYLLDLTDELHEAYDLLKVSCTQEASVRYVAAFTRVHNCMEHIKTPPRPPHGKTDSAITSSSVDTKAVAGV